MSRSTLALAIVTALACSHTAAADEPYTITIPGQGWSIAFESPPLRQFQGETNPKSFVFQATEEKAFNLSIFVEQPKKDEHTHDACFNYYWPLAKRNPLIDQGSVKIDKLEKFVKVTYNVTTGTESGINVNYYFAFQDRWVDLHVSLFPAAPDDAQKLAAFEKSLVYEKIKANDKPQ